MRKFEKLGCVRYAANEAKAEELKNMGYEEVPMKKTGKAAQPKKESKAENKQPKQETSVEGEADGSDTEDSK